MRHTWSFFVRTSNNIYPAGSSNPTSQHSTGATPNCVTDFERAHSKGLYPGIKLRFKVKGKWTITWSWLEKSARSSSDRQWKHATYTYFETFHKVIHTDLCRKCFYLWSKVAFVKCCFETKIESVWRLTTVLQLKCNSPIDVKGAFKPCNANRKVCLS